MIRALLLLLLLAAPLSARDTAQLRALCADAIKTNTPLDLDARDYHVSGTLAEIGFNERLTILGDGIRHTRIIAKGLTAPPFNIHGEDQRGNQFRHSNWSRFEGIEFIGSGSEQPCFDLRFAAHIYFTDCMFSQWAAPAVRGYSWWDTTFTRCHWLACGSPAVELLAAQNPNANNCNNIVWDNCRFENCSGTGIYFGWLASRCRVMSCKFDRVDGPNLHFDGARASAVVASQIISKPTGHAGILVEGGSDGIALVSPIICGRTVGVHLRDCGRVEVVAPVFGAVRRNVKDLLDERKTKEKK